MNKKKGLRRFFTLDVHNHEGFTLVELIIVIAILAILAGVAVVGYSAYVEKANKSADDALIYDINQAFRSACIDKNLDYFDLDGKVTAAVNDRVLGAVSVSGVSDFNEVFQMYLGNATVKFKHYKGLVYKAEIGGFEGTTEISTFDNPAVMEGIWNTFDTISGLLEQFGTAEPDEIEAGLMKHLSADLAQVLGMDGMIDGYIDATNLSDEELDDYLRTKIEGYDQKTDEEKTTLRNRLKANLGVMYFADAANTDDPQLLDKVMASLNVIVAATRDTSVTVTEEEILAYYLTTARGQAKMANDPDGVETDCAAFASDYDYMLGLTGTQLVVINKAVQNAIQETQNGQNTAGVNTLGALYALSAGYFNNTAYWTGDIPAIGNFPVVIAAMSQPNFEAYYSAYGEADVAAYLREMGQLSAKKDDLDLSKDDVFSGLNG